jgi:hypothetical protein
MTELEVFPQDNGHGDHAESEQEIFNRYAADPHIQKKARIVNNNQSRGKVSVYQKLEEHYDKQKYIKFSPLKKSGCSLSGNEHRQHSSCD